MNSKDYTVSGLNCQLVQAWAEKRKSVVQCLKKYSLFNIESWWPLKTVGGGGMEEGKDKLISQKPTSTRMYKEYLTETLSKWQYLAFSKSIEYTWEECEMPT